MAEASITVAVRVRPFSPKEATQLAPQEGVLPFLGDGGLAGSPFKNTPPGGAGGGAVSLRTRFIRPIIHTVDDKVLIFDPPDNNPLTRLYSNQASYMTHGQKRAKDVRYAFDKVFDGGCGQEDVFEGTTKPLLDGVLNGFNASVFAYGATGCGKTHTISGTSEDPGVIFLTMKELYQRIEDNRAESEVSISLSYLEIYNETIRDLLSDVPTPPGQGLLLREDNANKMSVVGITQHTPETPSHVLQMIQEGNCRRTMSPTEANAVSSRSHAVLQINVTSRPRTGDVMDETTSASLNIIDLAGSERASATRNNGARMKEGANINKSLLALGNCINALCQSGMRGKHIPYRNSKLTRLLKFSLGGNCKTVMIVCVSPSSSHYEETSNTLKYANQAKNIRTKVSRNITNVDRHVAQYVQTIHELREEIKELKERVKDAGAVESEGGKRRAAESRAELETVVKALTAKAEEVKQKINATASLEGESWSAGIKQTMYGKRIDELAKLSKDWSGRASPGEEEPTEWISERDFLQRLSQQAAEAVTASKAASARTDNAVHLFLSQVASAARTNKLVAEDLDRLKNAGAMLKSDVEAARAKARLQSVSAQLGEQVLQSMTWLRAATHSTVDMKEVAGELEWRAGQQEDSWANASSHIREVSEQLLKQAKQNDDLFQKYAGGCTSDHHSRGPRRPRINTASRAVPASRKVRSSYGHPLSSSPMSSPYSNKMAKSKPNYASGVAATRHMSTAPNSNGPSAASSRQAAASPRRAGRRPSISRAGRPSLSTGPTGRRLPVGRGGSAAPSRTKPDEEAVVPARNRIRWADELSGGQLEHSKKTQAVAKVLEPRRSTTPPWSPARVASEHRLRGSSPTEWEDLPGSSSAESVVQANQNTRVAAGRTTAPEGPPPRSLFGQVRPAARGHHPLKTQRNFSSGFDSSSDPSSDDRGYDLTLDDLLPGEASREQVNKSSGTQAKTRLSTLTAPTAASRARAAGGSGTGDSSSLQDVHFGVDENSSLALRRGSNLRRRESNTAPYRRPSRVSAQYARERPSRGPGNGQEGTSLLTNRSSSAVFPLGGADRGVGGSGDETGLGLGLPKVRSASIQPNAVRAPMRTRPSMAPTSTTSTSMFMRSGLDLPSLSALSGGGANSSMMSGSSFTSAAPKARGPPTNTAARARQSRDVVGTDAKTRGVPSPSSSPRIGSRATSPVVSFDARKAVQS